MSTSSKKSKSKTTTPTFDREPPQSIEAERALLSSIFLSPTNFHNVLEIFNYNIDDLFYYPPHQVIFKAMYEIQQVKGEMPEISAVVSYLEAKKQLDDAGGYSYLTELYNAIPTSANMEYYAELVFENALKRKLIEICNETTAKTYSGEFSFKELVDDIESRIYSIAMQRQINPIYKLEDFVRPFIKDLEARYESKEMLSGLPTGYATLDEKLCGLQASDMIVLAARPSVGKTAFALNIALHVAQHNMGVLIFSLEMSKELLLQRLICMKGQINGQLMRKSFVSKEMFQNIVITSGYIYKLPIYIDDSPNINIIELRSKARRHLFVHPDVKLIIIDYLQLMNVHRRGENRQVEIAEISRQIKGLARELKVPILTLCQLSREAEKESSEPRLSHLRESGAIEQDADVVLMLYLDKKEEKENKPKKDSVLVHLKIAKQRNGPTGIIDFQFRRDYQTFIEVNPFIETNDATPPYIDKEESPF